VILVVLLILLLLGKLLTNQHIEIAGFIPKASPCGARIHHGPVRSRISVKRAYIKGCPEMTCTGAAADRLGPPVRSVRDLRSRSH
jgi:hypothetical protein